MTPPTSPVRLASVTERTYQRLLSQEDNLEANRMMMDSISSLNRQRYTSLHREDNLLGSLMEPQSYLDNLSVHSAHSVTSHDANDPTNVSHHRGNVSVIM